jgi:hypothetical protein
MDRLCQSLICSETLFLYRSGLLCRLGCNILRKVTFISLHLSVTKYCMLISKEDDIDYCAIFKILISWLSNVTILIGYYGSKLNTISE